MFIQVHFRESCANFGWFKAQQCKRKITYNALLCRRPCPAREAIPWIKTGGKVPLFRDISVLICIQCSLLIHQMCLCFWTLVRPLLAVISLLVFSWKLFLPLNIHHLQILLIDSRGRVDRHLSQGCCHCELMDAICLLLITTLILDAPCPLVNIH